MSFHSRFHWGSACAALVSAAIHGAAFGGGPNFAGCGEIQVLGECGYALVVEPGATLLIEDIGPFQIGDVVFAIGSLQKECDQKGLPKSCAGIPCLMNASLGPCLDECGVLVLGAECVLFQGQTGLYVLENVGEFVVGDTVRVQGALDPECITICQEGDGCVTNNLISSIRSCPALFEACGTIVTPPFCGLALAADQGGLWLLDDVGGFAPGDRVFVSGSIVEDCIMIPECQAGGCVDVSLVEPCGKSYFSGCGEVIASFSCGLAFLADDGSGIYVLEDFGGADVGARIFVQGAIDIDCRAGSGFCSCIENDGVSMCIPVGDLDENGIVDGADLGLLLGAWGTCPPLQVGCLGDLNFDGEINGADLGVQLSNWTP